MPVTLGVLAVGVAGLAALQPPPEAPVSADRGAALSISQSAPPVPERSDIRASVEELRALSAASRAYARPPAPTPTPSPPAPPAPPPGPAPIVGRFLPVEGCHATVPAAPPPNGSLGVDQLCGVGDGHLLRADAAATYLALNDAFRAAFGVPLALTDSYRSYGSQARLYAQKPGLAARPGTSNHGWGIAVDVFGGVDSFSSPQHAWMSARGSEFGWVNPGWARADGSRPEPWHWEFDASLLD